MKSLYYAIGLDVGISSVGWAAVALDEGGEPCRLLDLGARIFEAAEQPKTGDSLAAPRRLARSMRRRLRRKRHRKERIRTLLTEELLTSQQLENLYQGRLQDIYALRTRALDEPLTNTELARVLLHLAQRRGFRSNRQNTAQDANQGKLLQAVEENHKRLDEHGYRTVGEMFYKDPDFAGHKRNQGEEYLCTVARDDIVQEVHAIFDAQRRLGVPFADPQLEARYLQLLTAQRSFAEGPGPGSPYHGSNDESTVGDCMLEGKGHPRAPKACYSFEKFTLLQAINHLRLEENGNSLPLDAQQRQLVLQLAHEVQNLTYARIRQKLGLAAQVLFKGVNYRGKSQEEAEKAAKFQYLRAYHQIRLALDKVNKNRIKSLSMAQLDEIGAVFTLNLEQEALAQRLLAVGLTRFDVKALAENLPGFRGRGHICLQACRKLLPFLEEGCTYDKACAQAGYNFKGHDDHQPTRLLAPTSEDYADITSPVVLRAASQTIKVINALVRRYGSPVYVNIEQARELAKSYAEREKEEKNIEAHRKKNEAAMDYLRQELGLVNPTGEDLVRYKLWEEQGGVCPYSQQHLAIERVFGEKGYADIDHIVPYSICFDNGYRNKVLVLSGENRQKGNHLPLQYLTGEKREHFIVWVRQHVRDPRKRQRLLKESLTQQELEDWKNRNLQDTQWMSRFLYNFIKDHLLLATMPGGKNRVLAVNGAITAELRKRWGINKVRADGDTHHARDAAVIACATQSMIQHISNYAARHEQRWVLSADGSWRIDPRTGEARERFPKPWPEFTKELEARLAPDPADLVTQLQLPGYTPQEALALQPVFVSRMPNHKVTGPAHKATVASPKGGEGYLLQKTPLSNLKLDKEGEIENYYMPQSDVLLYEALKARLQQFGGNGAKAFQEPFCKPKADGTPGPRVKSVKLLEKSTLSVPVQQGTGLAKHDTMVRVDVFYVAEDGYYLVPIYVADTLKAELPKKAVTRGEKFSEWKEMREEDFIFSLYPGDLIRVTAKRPLKMSILNKDSTLPKELTAQSVMLYYVSTGIAVASISVTNHDRSYGISSLGVKTLRSLEKYQVDVLGRYTKVQRETRQPFFQKHTAVPPQKDD